MKTKIKTFQNQDMEYSVYPLKNPVDLALVTMPKAKLKPAVPDSWQVVLTCPSTFPIKTGLGLNQKKEDFVILSSAFGPHKIEKR